MSKTKKAVVAVAAVAGLSLGASACGQFAPTSDVSAIAGAVKQGVIAQNRGNVRSDCTFSNGGSTVNGIEESWQKSGDRGYVCIGRISVDFNLYYNITGGTNANNGLPFYPVAYFNSIGTKSEGVTYGTAAVISQSKVAVQIAVNGIQSIQTIAVVTVTSVYNPFADVARK